jgi:hypothetical protein
MNKEYTPEQAKAWLAGYDEGKRFAKKEWVGLTDEEMFDMYAKHYHEGRKYSLGRLVEAKLKEKNNG